MFPPNMCENHQHLVEMSNETNPESNLDIPRDDEHDNSIMEAPSGDDNNPNQRPTRKRRYHRHTQHQIQELEAYFKDNPHPDDKQRKELGTRLSLEPLQIKFWFQNKRTQTKTEYERYGNTRLRNENERLRAEIIYNQTSLANATCPNCGGPTTNGEMSFDEQQLRIENARLRDEVDRISGFVAKYVGRPTMSHSELLQPHGSSHSSLDLTAANFSSQGMVGEMFGAGDVPLRSMADGPIDQTMQPIIIQLAITAMEELIGMAQFGEPLWVHNSDNSSHETLCEDEYQRSFPRSVRPKPIGLKCEASRESVVVVMNNTTLVEILMDVNRWSNVFCGIVSKASTLEVFSTGEAGNYDGALQVMRAEYQFPSPLVLTRENYFARYCKQLGDATWVVVDVSLDHLRSSSIPRCRRRPSGCMIRQLPNGFSKVTWVEHVEVFNEAVHDTYKGLVNSGLAFGAKRWVATLDRQCERLAIAMASDIPVGGHGVITTLEGRKSILKLAERMVSSFCSGVGASTAHPWTTIWGSGANDVRVVTRKSIDDPGRPSGVVLSAATSIWLPVKPEQIFNFLRDENSRSLWDIFSNCALVHEIAHITYGRDPGNCVSLLRVTNENSSQSNMLILQESLSDPTGLYIIYAPVDMASMNAVLSGGDPDYVALLPSGFAIHPDRPGQFHGGVPTIGTGGSLLTIAFQILVDPVPTSKLSLSSVAKVSGLIKSTVEMIKAAVNCANL